MLKLATLGVVAGLTLSAATPAVPTAPKAVARAASSNPNRVFVDPTRDNVAPQILDGNGWTTTFTVANLDVKPVLVHVEFVNDDGSNLTLAVNGIGYTTGVDITLAVGGSYSITTSNASSNAIGGFAYLGTDNHTDKFGGYIFLRNHVDGYADIELTTPLVPIDENAFSLTFDHTNQAYTIVPIVNLDSNSSALVQMTLLDQNGNLIANDSVTIPSGGRVRVDLQARFPQILQGTVRFSTGGSKYVSAYGYRVDGGGMIVGIPPVSIF